LLRLLRLRRLRRLLRLLRLRRLLRLLRSARKALVREPGSSEVLGCPVYVLWKKKTRQLRSAGLPDLFFV
jgi:hypothetical protein